jgi:hypothetical protein
MTSFRGQASWAKMMSPGGKLTALACHPTTKSKHSRVIDLSLNKHWVMLEKKILSESNALAYYGTG